MNRLLKLGFLLSFCDTIPLSIISLLEKSERGERGLVKEHEENLIELRKELEERDERIEELQIEHKEEMQVIVLFQV